MSPARPTPSHWRGGHRLGASSHTSDSQKRPGHYASQSCELHFFGPINFL
jgi:hypothetical protein